ncbi:MAG: hypothetical protein SFT90_07530 [Rickettsiales bacterium]|nr:hypothetical protein [Rickettsiales bacterium]
MKSSLFRSETYFIFQNITSKEDFIDAKGNHILDKFHKDVAVSIELFDMITYIENAYYDGKDGFKKGSESDYFAVSNKILNHIEEILSQHGERGKKVFEIIKQNYDDVKETQEAVLKGEIPSIFELAEKNASKDEIESFYQRRLKGYDTTAVIADILEADVNLMANDKNGLRKELIAFFRNEIFVNMEKPNDIADLNPNKANTGADWLKGEITRLTDGFSELPKKDQLYIKNRLKYDLNPDRINKATGTDLRDFSRINDIMARNGCFQRALEDIYEVRGRIIKGMESLINKALESPENSPVNLKQAFFLLKKVDIYFNNKRIKQVEDLVAAGRSRTIA